MLRGDCNACGASLDEPAFYLLRRMVGNQMKCFRLDGESHASYSVYQRCFLGETNTKVAHYGKVEG